MDLYSTVTGDVEAMQQFDRYLGGLGRDTFSQVKERVELNSKHDKVETVVEGVSPYFKSDYELFVEHHKMLMEAYVATQLHLQNILDKKNEVKSIAKLANLCEKHQCSNIAELLIQQGNNEYVMQCFVEFEAHLNSEPNLNTDFKRLGDSFESYRYNINICNNLSGLDQPFSSKVPNRTQLDFIINSRSSINQTLRSYMEMIDQQQNSVDSLRNTANYTALIPLATNDKNLFSQAATEIYVLQSPLYQDYQKLIKNELRNSQETGISIFDKHLREVNNPPKPQEVERSSDVSFGI